MNDRRRLLLIALIAFFAAVAGVLVGRAYVARQTPVETELHTLLHSQLELDSGQHARIEEIERRFAVRKQALELELRADNARLADAGRQWIDAHNAALLDELEAHSMAHHDLGPGARGAVDARRGDVLLAAGPARTARRLCPKVTRRFDRTVPPFGPR